MHLSPGHHPHGEEHGRLDTEQEPPGEVFSHSEYLIAAVTHSLVGSVASDKRYREGFFLFLSLDLCLLKPFLGAKGYPRFLCEEIC